MKALIVKTMKKTYIIPNTFVCQVYAEHIIAGSQDITSNNDITYGGVDEEGNKDPNAKQNHYNVWDDDWRQK